MEGIVTPAQTISEIVDLVRAFDEGAAPFAALDRDVRAASADSRAHWLVSAARK